MATTPANLSKVTSYDGGLDSIVIKKYLAGVEGGRTLAIGESFTLETIKAGHVIIKTSAGDYTPMPVNSDGDAYDSLPSGASYVGVLVADILTSKPIAPIMTMGQVNASACPYALTSDIKAGLSHINFM